MENREESIEIYQKAGFNKKKIRRITRKYQKINQPGIVLNIFLNCTQIEQQEGNKK